MVVLIRDVQYKERKKYKFDSRSTDSLCPPLAGSHSVFPLSDHVYIQLNRGKSNNVLVITKSVIS